MKPKEETFRNTWENENLRGLYATWTNLKRSKEETFKGWKILCK